VLGQISLFEIDNKLALKNRVSVELIKPNEAKYIVGFINSRSSYARMY